MPTTRGDRAGSRPAPRPPYRLAEPVFGIWPHPEHGTVGAHGVVTACTPVAGSTDWRLEVRFGSHHETYNVSRTGHSDYVGRPQADPTPTHPTGATR